MAIRWKATLLARALVTFAAKTAARLRTLFFTCNIRLTANKYNNNNTKSFINTLYYVTCYRDLCVATPLAGDVGDALPKVIC